MWIICTFTRWTGFNTGMISTQLSVGICSHLRPYRKYITIVPTVQFHLSRQEMKWNEWCFRPRFCTVRIYWAGDVGEWDIIYESCPWRRIDRSTCRPAVQRATIVLRMSPITKQEKAAKMCPLRTIKSRDVGVCHEMFYKLTQITLHGWCSIGYIKHEKQVARLTV